MVGIGKEREIVLCFSWRIYHMEGNVGLGPLQIVSFFRDKEGHHRWRGKQEQRLKSGER